MRHLPVRPVEDLLQQGPFLVLAPHPDDESLGCGGLIAAACAADSLVHVLILTDGAGSHPRSAAVPPDRLRLLRAQEARDAVAALGLPSHRLGFLGLPDTRSPMAGEPLALAAQAVATLIRRERIATVLAPWRHDPHCDHQSAHLIAVLAASQTGARHRAYPVWGWTLPPHAPLAGPAPAGVRFDVAAFLGAKRRAIAAHRSQYAGLITDDPGGFQLPPGFLALFDGPYETLLDVP